LSKNKTNMSETPGHGPRHSADLNLDLLALLPVQEDPYQSDGQALSRITEQLGVDHEDVNPDLMNQLDDYRLLDRLQAHCEHTGIPLIEYVRHSNRFSNLNRFGGMFNPDALVTIPEGTDNVHANGHPRPHEEGHRMNLNYLRGKGVDPRYVLCFRVTQPMGDQPKPEYYWTSDFKETRDALNAELGLKQAATALILVSTLEAIAQNGGLIDDMNDDQGVAVRQIGLGPFDQGQAIATLNRVDV
jgi:hypothetical protein